MAVVVARTIGQEVGKESCLLWVDRTSSLLLLLSNCCDVLVDCFPFLPFALFLSLNRITAAINMAIDARR